MFGTGAFPITHVSLSGRRILPLAALCVVFAGVAPASGYPLFSPPSRTYETAGQVTALAVGDMNGDGKPDLVVANEAARAVSILLGSGDGRFSGPIIMTTSVSPVSLALADLDSNGALDLIIGMQGGIGIRMGQGGGVFLPLAVRIVPGQPWQVLSCHLNADAHPDLVYRDANGLAVQSILGNGDGTFGSVLVRSGLPYPNGIAVGDLNADGKLDLLVGTGDCGGELSRALGNGDGTFGPVLQFDPLVCNPVSPTIGDVTGDGHADAVISVLGRSKAYVYPGNGNGTFGAKVEYALGGASFELLLADFNLDGRPDVAAAAASSGVVSTLLATESGLLPRQDCTVGSNVYALASGDFNLDGLPDLVVGGSASKLVTILLNTGGLLPLAVSFDGSHGNRFGLRISPSPLARSSRVSFTLGTRAAVRLRVFDLAGRLVADRDLGELGPGAHEARLGLDVESTRAGFYIVQLSAGSEHAAVGAPFVE